MHEFQHRALGKLMKYATSGITLSAWSWQILGLFLDFSEKEIRTSWEPWQWHPFCGWYFQVYLLEHVESRSFQISLLSLFLVFQMTINSLGPGRCGSNFSSVFFKLSSVGKHTSKNRSLLYAQYKISLNQAKFLPSTPHLNKPLPEPMLTQF